MADGGVSPGTAKRPDPLQAGAFRLVRQTARRMRGAILPWRADSGGAADEYDTQSDADGQPDTGSVKTRLVARAVRYDDGTDTAGGHSH
jgi:hypothetical protein